VFIKINCESRLHDLDINVKLVMVPSPCWDFSNTVKEATDVSKLIKKRMN
jgi:hypothetical protein